MDTRMEMNKWKWYVIITDLPISLVLTAFGEKPKEFDFAHQNVSRWEACTGWAQDYSILLWLYAPRPHLKIVKRAWSHCYQELTVCLCTHVHVFLPDIPAEVCLVMLGSILGLFYLGRSYLNVPIKLLHV